MLNFILFSFFFHKLIKKTQKCYVRKIEDYFFFDYHHLNKRKINSIFKTDRENCVILFLFHLNFKG